MKYVLLAYGGAHLSSMPAAELEALGAACEANDAALCQSGHLRSVEGLDGGVTTVRIHEGALSVDDGPLVASDEPLLGLFLIDAEDLNEAIRVASNMPQVRGGPIEVRPVLA